MIYRGKSFINTSYHTTRDHSHASQTDNENHDAENPGGHGISSCR